MAGPSYDDELDGSNDVRGAVPCQYFGEGVGSNDEVELIVRRQAAPQALDRIDGVTLSRARFDIGSLKQRFPFTSKLHHPQTIGVGSGCVGLMRRVRRRHEHDAIELELMYRFPGHREMRAVDGIEGTAEDCELQFRLLSAQPRAMVDVISGAMAQDLTSGPSVAFPVQLFD